MRRHAKRGSERELDAILNAKNERVKELTKENIALRFQLSDYIGKCHFLKKQLVELQHAYKELLKEVSDAT